MVESWGGGGGGGGRRGSSSFRMVWSVFTKGSSQLYNGDCLCYIELMHACYLFRCFILQKIKCNGHNYYNFLEHCACFILCIRSCI